MVTLKQLQNLNEACRNLENIRNQAIIMRQVRILTRLYKNDTGAIPLTLFAINVHLTRTA